MRNDSATSAIAAKKELGPPPPDWEKVPFDVGCARCGQDLRGLAEPRCPACGLEFDWAEAVPIDQLRCQHCRYHLYGLRETRCPECGERFTWEEALAAYRRKDLPLFEYQWRERPIRSFIGTWFRALVPGMLWRGVTIHDPPQVEPLWVMVGIALLASLALGPVLEGSIMWGEQRWIATSLPGLQKLVQQVRLHQFLIILTFLWSSVLWCATSFAPLMIFRQSMRRYQVRAAHVFRVWSYASALLAPSARPSTPTAADRRPRRSPSGPLPALRRTR